MCSIFVVNPRWGNRQIELIEKLQNRLRIFSRHDENLERVPQFVKVARYSGVDRVKAQPMDFILRTEAIPGGEEWFSEAFRCILKLNEEHVVIRLRSNRPAGIRGFD